MSVNEYINNEKPISNDEFLKLFYKKLLNITYELKKIGNSKEVNDLRKKHELTSKVLQSFSIINQYAETGVLSEILVTLSIYFGEATSLGKTSNYDAIIATLEILLSKEI